MPLLLEADALLLRFLRAGFLLAVVLFFAFLLRLFVFLEAAFLLFFLLRAIIPPYGISIPANNFTLASIVFFFQLETRKTSMVKSSCCAIPWLKR